MHSPHEDGAVLPFPLSAALCAPNAPGLGVGGAVSRSRCDTIPAVQAHCLVGEAGGTSMSLEPSWGI